MKTGLLSIHEQYADQIFAGTKKYEFRRKAPRLESKTRFLIYVPGRRKELAGEMVVSEVISKPRRTLWNQTKHHSGISEEAFMAYFEGRDVAHALVIKSTKRYAEPMGLEDLRQTAPDGFWPPQYLQWVRPSFLSAVLA
ncbi:MAG: ASCH domain-containing protein [Thermoplasmatota archaeon]